MRKYLHLSLVLAIILTFGISGCGGGGNNSNGSNVIIDPQEVILPPGGSQQFTANQTVTWKVQETDGGVIDTNGNYTAPDHTGTFHVVATSTANPSKSATAPVYVVTGGGGSKYKGTISITRTHHSSEVTLDESMDVNNVILIYNPDGSVWFMPVPKSVTTVADWQDETQAVHSPLQTVEDDVAAIVLFIYATTYTLTVGPVTVPAQITYGGSTFDDFYGIDGETAEDMPLPANTSRLTSSKTITETSGATVVMEWDLILAP